MTDFLKVHDLLHSSQSGFRRGHSTDAWLSAFNKRQISGAVFLDLRNTFDLVNYDILLKKAIGLQFKHRGYHILTILLTWSTTVRTCKWHILQQNVYHVWSSSRVDLDTSYFTHKWETRGGRERLPSRMGPKDLPTALITCRTCSAYLALVGFEWELSS